MANWLQIIDSIFNLIDIGDDRPAVCEVNNLSANYFKIDRTLYRVSENQLWIYTRGKDKIYTLFTIFHECWHALQKSKGVQLRYSEDDREKYVGKEHMMMLYKYPFEAEATGYASAFVFELYSLVKNTNFNNIDREIEDKHDNVDNYPESEFDTHDDYLQINKMISDYYEEGKLFFENMLNDNSEIVEALGEEIDKVPKETIKLASKKGMQFSLINSALK